MSRGRARLLLLAWWCGLWRPPDRVLLEDTLLPHYAPRARGGRALFVGVRFYTRCYPRLFGGCELTTLDRDPAMRRHGAARHVTDSLENLARHFPPGHFQLIVANGVFGWGLDAPADVEAALAACHACLVPGGDLVLGVNELRAATPRLDASVALRKFSPAADAPGGAARVVVHTPLGEGTHTFLFFRRPVA